MKFQFVQGCPKKWPKMQDFRTSFTEYPLNMGTAKPGQLFTKMDPGVFNDLGQRETANSMVCFIGHES